VASSTTASGVRYGEVVPAVRDAERKRSRLFRSYVVGIFSGEIEAGRCKEAREVQRKTGSSGRLTRAGGRLAFAAVVAFAVLGSTPVVASGPFSELAGTWRGDGTVIYTDGSRESLHCRSDYQVAADGNALQQTMRCATAGFSFIISAQLSHSGGALSGQWSESAYNQSGQVTGRAAPGQVRATVRAADFGANIAVNTREGLQQYSVRSEGTRVAEVVIRLRRQAG
jgi:hypothetical protein